TVEFQACNDQLCLAPVSVPFSVAVSVTGGSGGATRGGWGDGGGAPAAAPGTGAATSTSEGPGALTPVRAAPPAAAAGSAAPRDGLESALARGGLGWFLALFAGGLLLNLTPCVFPMIGVTVSIFGARRKEPLPKVMSTAALYVLGICAMYT